jgi:uncharacterized protein (TIGR02266 family)
MATDFLVRATIASREGVFGCKCRNLSQGGAFIQMAHPFPPGTRIQLQIHLDPIEENLVAEAEVVWARSTALDFRRPAGMGVKFTRLEAEDERLVILTLAALRKSRVSGTPCSIR